MGMYAKLMGRITESSLMEEPINVRYCFMMMLAIADPKGYVVGTDVAVARRINMSLEEFKECVRVLMLPDPDSNSKDHEGRRVIVSDCERGYFLVNYAKYRDTRDEEERREYMREYMRKYRGESDVTDVNSGKPSKPKKEESGEVKEKGEADKANGKRGTREEMDAFFLELKLPKSDAEWFFFKCEGNGWKNGGKPILNWKATVRSWKSGGYLPSQKLLPNGKPANPQPIGTPKSDPTGWREFLVTMKSEYREYQYAPDFLKTDFNNSRK